MDVVSSSCYLLGYTSVLCGCCSLPSSGHPQQTRDLPERLLHQQTVPEPTGQQAYTQRLPSLTADYGQRATHSGPLPIDLSNVSCDFFSTFQHLRREANFILFYLCRN